MKNYKELLEKEFISLIQNLSEKDKTGYNSIEDFRKEDEDRGTLDEFLSFAEKVLQKFDKIGLPPKYELEARYGFSINLEWETHELSPLWIIRAEIKKGKERLLIGSSKTSLKDLVERVQNAQKPHPFLLNPTKEPLVVYAITYSDYDIFEIVSMYTTEEEAKEKFALLHNNPINDFSKSDCYSIIKYDNTSVVSRMWYTIHSRRENGD